MLVVCRHVFLDIPPNMICDMYVGFCGPKNVSGQIMFEGNFTSLCKTAFLVFDGSSPLFS
jgi:hypothetical protein